MSSAVSTRLDRARVRSQWAVLPPLAGDDPELLHLPVQRHLPGLPPLVVGRVHHVQDVPELKVEALAGQPGVLGFVIVKQRPAKHTHSTSAGQQHPGVATQTRPTRKPSMKSPNLTATGLTDEHL